MRLHVLPLAVSLLLINPITHATVRPHHHSSSHPIVRRSTSTHAGHQGHVAEHSSYAGIGTDRATEIQSALIQRGYLFGEPTGAWDTASIAAMQKLQSDNGWQTKFVPDSRALIKLGLGAGSTSASGTPASAAPPVSAAATSQPEQTF